MDNNPEKLDSEDVSRLKEVSEWWGEKRDSGVSQTTRRKFLGLAAGAGLGAASVGGYATGQAAAGSESAGVIGTEDKPADAYLEDVYDHGGNQPMSFPGDGSVSIGSVQNNISNAPIQTAWDGLVVPVAEGVGMMHAIDPAETSTPVQDAIDVINSQGMQWGGVRGGAVLLPPTWVTNDGSLTGLAGKTIKGWGVNTSVVEITDLSSHGIDIGGPADGERAYLDGLCLHGSDKSARTAGSAMYWHTNNHKRFDIGNLRLNAWGGPDPAIHWDTASPFHSNWGCVRVTGSDTDGWRMDDAGTNNHCSVFAVELDPGNIGINWSYPTGGQTIDQLNVNYQADRVGNIQADGFHCHIGHVHFESDYDSHSGGAAIYMTGSSTTSIGSLKTYNSTFDVIYRQDTDGGNNILGPVNTAGGSTLNTNIVQVVSEPAAPSWYWGESSDIDIAGSWTDTGLMRSLDTAGTGHA